MFGNIFKRKPAGWNDLSAEKQQHIAKQISKHIQALAGARYKIVSGFDQTQRERGVIETNDEDKILNGYSRGRLLDLTRNAVRNSATFNTILKQLDFNVCGTKAGKAILNFSDIGLSKEIIELFSRFTRQADFFDGHSFNTVLKMILKNALIGGDCVILFDNGLVEDSGKLLIYESDEIGNTSEEALKAHYGAFARQSLGKVYNGNSRWIGTVVSRSQRGAEEFDPTKCYFLKRDPDASVFESLWLQPSNVWRPSQGRGVSQSASSLATILDLEDLCGYELQAAKKAA